MRRRAEQVAETRRRIVEATVRLHRTIGLTATTVSAVAEEAGVTRLTVYRHFPDVVALYSACTAHWMSQQVPPDPDAWARIAEPGARLRAGLLDLYRYYRGDEPMLTHVHHDEADIPEENRGLLREMDARHRAVLIDPFTLTGRRRTRVAAMIGHAVAFSTWRSLCITEGLSDREAAGAMASLILTAAGL